MEIKYVTNCNMKAKDFLPGCGREEKGADKCQKDRDQQLGKSELAEINAKARQEGMSYGKYVGLMYCEERDEMERRRRYDRKRRERFG